MQSVERGGEIRVYWASPELQTGVVGATCSAKTDLGTVLAAGSALVELGGGVYVAELGTIDEDCYVLATVGSPATATEGAVLVVGEPDAKLWYVDGSLQNGRTLTWAVMDRDDASTVSSGAMTDEGGGFYSASPSGVPDGNYLVRLGDEVAPATFPLSSGAETIVVEQVVQRLPELLGGGVSAVHPALLREQRPMSGGPTRVPRVTATLREDSFGTSWWDFAKGKVKAKSAEIDAERDVEGTVTAVLVESFSEPKSM